MVYIWHKINVKNICDKKKKIYFFINNILNAS